MEETTLASKREYIRMLAQKVSFMTSEQREVLLSRMENMNAGQLSQTANALRTAFSSQSKILEAQFLEHPTFANEFETFVDTQKQKMDAEMESAKQRGEISSSVIQK